MKTIVLIFILFISGFGLIFISNSRHSTEDLIIFTQIPGGQNDYFSAFPANARIVALKKDYRNPSVEILTSAFQSAKSPQISFDGRKMIFSGKLKDSEPWQIWEMDLDSREITQLTFGSYNCTDPVYLPNGKILFSREVDLANHTKGFALFTIDENGDSERITFHPHKDILSSVSLDGRVITNSSQLFPDVKENKFIAMRPDGTKSILYYQGPEGMEPISRGYETNDRRFVFIETNSTESRSSIVSISLNRPLNSRNVEADAGKDGVFHSIYPSSDGSAILSYKESGLPNFNLYSFQFKSGRVIDSLVYSDPEWHAVEAILASPRPIPKKLPTRVDKASDTGKMLCLNSTHTDLQPFEPEDLFAIQVQGVNNIIGTVEVEQDGSFYIETKADTPIRFQALDKNRKEILEPSSWLWVRPDENRGCVGCHENREMAPANRIPEAIKNPPISLVDIFPQETEDFIQ